MIWQLDYRINGKRKTLTRGLYPDVSLKIARDKRDKARAKIAGGIAQACIPQKYSSCPAAGELACSGG